MAGVASPHGFEAGDWTPPVPRIEVSDVGRAGMVHLLAAAVCGHTPERALECLRSGEWPVDVVELLGRDLEPEEMGAHLDLLLCVLDGTLP